MDIKDLYWAVGFLEGEGNFNYQAKSYMMKSGKLCNKGAKYPKFAVKASQVQREPLERLQKLFNGSIYGPINKKHPNQNPQYAWQVTGPRARGVMMTVYSLMSPKRKGQIKYALTQPQSVFL